MTGPRRCLVFGGTGALGRVVCEELASEGAQVAFTFHSAREAASELAAQLPASAAFPLDLACLTQLDETIAAAHAHLGGLDAFVQCAGVALTIPHIAPKVHHPIAEVNECGWDRMFDVNVKGTFFALRTMLPLLRANGGNIVLTGSVDGVKPVPAPVHYAAAKGALSAMAQAAAKEIGADNIRINVVAPGIMEAGVSRALPDETLREYLKHCGLKRTGKLSEVAAVIAWLALHNTYLTGQTILVDGAL